MVKVGWLPLVIAGVAAALGLLLPRPVSSAAASVPPLATGEVDVKTVYLADCAVCHGQDGHGTSRGISLVGQGRAAVDYALTTGRMPLAANGRSEEPGRPVSPLPLTGLGNPDEVPIRHAPAYPPEVIRALDDYVAQLTDGSGPDIPTLEAGDVVEGGVQFRLQCAACHSWSGQGGALVKRAVPALGAATPLQVAEAVRSGPGQMPAFGQAALDDQQLSGLVAYVNGLKHPSDRGGNALGHLGPVAEGAAALVGLVGLLALCRWIGEREPEGGEDEPAGATTSGSGGQTEPAGSGGQTEPAGSGGHTEPARSGGRGR